MNGARENSHQTAIFELKIIIEYFNRFDLVDDLHEKWEPVWQEKT